jgi:soluble lytic murein transglycosylase-like protein
LNIDGGVRYFKKLLERFDNNVQLALAAYNAGSRYVLKYGGVPPFRATRVYIRKVLNYHRKLNGETAAVGNGPTTT